MTIYRCRYGDFLVPERNDLIFNALRVYGEWAQEELDMLGRFVRPGDTVLDVGAFIGTHARAFSQMVGAQGSVHAFEPNERSYCELLKNAQLAPHSNIKLYQMALGGCKQSRFLLQGDFLTNLGASRLSEGSCGAGDSVVAVEILDDFNFPCVDFIKADVESMEYDVLVGGARTIRQHKPIVFLEANSLQATSRVVDWAHGMDYAVFGHVSSAFNPDNFNRSTEDMFGEAKECGLLLIHKDRLSIWWDILSSLGLPTIETIDDLSLLLLNKPQYVYEVLEGAEVFKRVAELKQVIAEQDELLLAHHEQLILMAKELERTQQAKGAAMELAHRHLSECESLQSQLSATESAKDTAVELAHKHLSECENLQAQLVATEAAKANSEQQAVVHYGRLETIAEELKRYNGNLAEKINNLEVELFKENEFVRQVINSRSWRVTRRLRMLGVWWRRWMGGMRQISVFPRAVRQNRALCDVQRRRQIAVVLPVYRDIEMTVACIEAALPGILSLEGAMLVIVNDASPDAGMQDALVGVASNNPERVFVLANESNLGFVVSVNRGMRKFPEADVVLLNSDVIVPSNWLSRLREDAYSRVNAATVTPLSNNTTICTFPRFLQDNDVPFGMSVDAVDKFFSCTNFECIEAPTGIGFCMFIKRIALDDVGYFDEGRFGRGYGEENDFCQRAIARGYVNLISPNIYAYHKGGVSFGAEKSALMDNAARVIDSLYPHYNAAVRSFIESDQLKRPRILRYAKLLSGVSQPKILLVSHGIGGGVDQHIEELERFLKLRAAFLVLMPSSDGLVELKFGAEKGSDSVFYKVPEQIPELVTLLRSLGVSLVHYHHVLRLHPELLKLPDELGVRHIFTVHDYYVLCGNPSLTDENGLYPGFRDDDVVNPLYPREGMTAQGWREKYKHLMESAEIVIFPSQATMDIFSDSFSLNCPLVVQHIEIDRDHCFESRVFQRKERYEICALGAIGREKGADFLEQIAIYANEKNLPYDFSIIGYAYRPLRHVKVTGPYQPEMLLDIIKERGVDVVMFPAKCPETYSYTLSYALSAGVPILAPNIGSFPERLALHGSAKIFSYNASPAEVFDSLHSFINDLVAGKNMVSEPDPGRNFSDFFYEERYLSLCADMCKSNFDVTLISDMSNSKQKEKDVIDFTISLLWRLYTSRYMRWIDLFLSYKTLRSVKRRLTNRSIG